MKVRVHSIPLVGGLDLDFILAPEVLMGEPTAHGANENFSQAVQCQAHLDILDQEVLVRAKASTKVDSLCYRCGEAVSHPVEVDLLVSCTPRRKSIMGRRNRAQHGEMEQDSQEGLVYFDHQEIDLDPIVREQVLLSLPMRYLCSKQCQGLCLACGANLNFGPHECTKASLGQAM